MKILYIIGDKMKRSISLRDLNRWNSQRNKVVVKLPQSLIDNEPRDLGRMSDQEYNKYIEEHSQSLRGWSI